MYSIVICSWKTTQNIWEIYAEPNELLIYLLH